MSFDKIFDLTAGGGVFFFFDNIYSGVYIYVCVPLSLKFNSRGFNFEEESAGRSQIEKREHTLHSDRSRR